MDENGLCNDIDECADPSLNKCWSQNDCRNTPGSYKCSCPDGFRGNGINCNDIDECATGQHNCHSLGECQNEIGSFKCVCNKGTLGNGTYCEEFPRPGDTLARSLHEPQDDPSDDVGVQCDKHRMDYVPLERKLMPSAFIVFDSLPHHEVCA